MTEKVTLVLTQDQKLMPKEGPGYEEMNPKALFLAAAAKCGGLTALMIMQKERIAPRHFEITVSGEMSTDTVRAETVFTSFNVIYHIECENEGDKPKANNAADLSHEKYCGVAQMLRKIAPITHKVNVK